KNGNPRGFGKGRGGIDRAKRETRRHADGAGKMARAQFRRGNCRNDVEIDRARSGTRRRRVASYEGQLRLRASTPVEIAGQNRRMNSLLAHPMLNKEQA